jgi:hypothetical protein
METKGRMDKEGGARRKEAIVKKEKNTETFAAVPRTSELLVIQGKQLYDFKVMMQMCLWMKLPS